MPTTETLTDSGTWTAPAGIQSPMTVECYGAGGAGEAQDLDGASGGAGGGGGGYSLGSFAITPAQEVSHTIDASSTTWGVDADVVAAAGASGAAGAGGDGGGGDHSGGNGADSGLTYGGGGGSGAGPNGNGVSATVQAGAAGTNGGAGGAGAIVFNNGSAGSNYGGGGGGAGPTGGEGGAGGAGKIVLTYTVVLGTAYTLTANVGTFGLTGNTAGQIGGPVAIRNTATMKARSVRNGFEVSQDGDDYGSPLGPLTSVRGGWNEL